MSNPPKLEGKTQLADMRLRLGLRRSLICFAPLAFVSQRQFPYRDAPSPLVFPAVSTHFTAPPQVPVPLKRILSRQFFTPYYG